MRLLVYSAIALFTAACWYAVYTYPLALIAWILASAAGIETYWRVQDWRERRRRERAVPRAWVN